MSKELIECDLYLSVSRNHVRMGANCENPSVRTGSAKCGHFCAQPGKVSHLAPDVTGACRRSAAARTAARVDRPDIGQFYN